MRRRRSYHLSPSLARTGHWAIKNVTLHGNALRELRRAGSGIIFSSHIFFVFVGFGGVTLEYSEPNRAQVSLPVAR